MVPKEWEEEVAWISSYVKNTCKGIYVVMGPFCALQSRGVFERLQYWFW